MAAVLSIYLELSLEMRDALRALAKPNAEGYASWAGATITFNGGHAAVRKQTLKALVRRDLVTEWQAASGTQRYAITNLGRNVMQEA